jgi:hypothetical protein
MGRPYNDGGQCPSYIYFMGLGEGVRAFALSPLPRNFLL